MSSKSKDQCKNASAPIKFGAFIVEPALPPVKQPELERSPMDLFKDLKFFLVVGRLIGTLPYSGVFKNSYTQLHFKLKSPAAIFSISVFILLVFNLVFGVIETVRLPKTNALEIAKSVRTTVQFVWSTIIYFNFLLRGKKFLSLFSHWAKTSVFYGMPDTNLRRDSIFITLIILTSAILENAVLHLEYIEALDTISGQQFQISSHNKSVLETYYRRSHDHWVWVIGFHEIIAVVAFIQHKCMLYTCNYMDIMIAVFSRAIYFKFKTLYRLANEHLAKPVREGLVTRRSKVVSRHAWFQLAQDHKTLSDFLQHMEDFFSPLVFGSYAVNIYYICIQLFDGLTTDMSANSLVHSIYAPWSFLHIIMRVYIVSICAARINVYAHQVRDVLQECPTEFYGAEIARFDKKVTSGSDIGLTGLGCFIVTKPFILRIISVVFTFEIVLLQGVPSAGSSTVSC